MLPNRTFVSVLVALVATVAACSTTSGTSQIDAERLNGEWVMSPDSLKLLVDAAAPHPAAEVSLDRTKSGSAV